MGWSVSMAVPTIEDGDYFPSADRSGKWVGWVGPDLEIYF